MNYYNISQKELGDNSKIALLKLGDNGEVFYELAFEMLKEIKKANNENRQAVFIVPVGPVGQYPIFVRYINENNISLKNCYFINMDEYLTDDGKYIDKNSALSFRGYMEREVYGKINNELLMPENQRIFPCPEKPHAVTQLVEKLGRVDIVFGGIGLNGHLAFNEPEPNLSVEEFSNLTTRVLDIAQETRTTNCMGNLGGAIEHMPKKCVTVGMKEILSAKKIRLGVFRNWHRAVVRRVAYGEISTSCPASILQTHSDVLVYLNDNVSRQAY